MRSFGSLFDCASSDTSTNHATIIAHAILTRERQSFMRIATLVALRSSQDELDFDQYGDGIERPKKVKVSVIGVRDGCEFHISYSLTRRGCGCRA